MLKQRQFEFPVERAVYLTVLHRLFETGSDRRADRWRRDVAVAEARICNCTVSTERCIGWARPRTR